MLAIQKPLLRTGRLQSTEVCIILLGSFSGFHLLLSLVSSLVRTGLFINSSRAVFSRCL